ncbi:hypothetical protein, partial [Bifidobacterium pullorum]|uniref:hypothetical protein n=1 Tax=Bifidobacterium pullorum TaxID=78448 RepID=UPI00307C437A
KPVNRANVPRGLMVAGHETTGPVFSHIGHGVIPGFSGRPRHKMKKWQIEPHIWLEKWHTDHQRRLEKWHRNATIIRNTTF